MQGRRGRNKEARERERVVGWVERERVRESTPKWEEVLPCAAVSGLRRQKHQSLCILTRDYLLPAKVRPTDEMEHEGTKGADGGLTPLPSCSPPLLPLPVPIKRQTPATSYAPPKPLDVPGRQPARRSRDPAQPVRCRGCRAPAGPPGPKSLPLTDLRRQRTATDPPSDHPLAPPFH